MVPQIKNINKDMEIILEEPSGNSEVKKYSNWNTKNFLEGLNSRFEFQKKELSNLKTGWKRLCNLRNREREREKTNEEKWKRS